jgi:hypothetical protein
VARGLRPAAPLTGAAVTAETMFTHRDVGPAVSGGEGDHRRPAPKNPPALRRNIQATLAHPPGLPPGRQAGLGRHGSGPVL